MTSKKLNEGTPIFCQVSKRELMNSVIFLDSETKCAPAQKAWYARLEHCKESDETLTPSVGTEATIHSGSDRRGGTVTKVSPSGKAIWVQEDVPVALPSFSTEGSTTKATLRSDGKYRVVGGRSLVSLGVAAKCSA